MRLKAALADLQPGLQNQTALDIIFKLCSVKNLCSVNDEGLKTVTKKTGCLMCLAWGLFLFHFLTLGIMQIAP